MGFGGGLGVGGEGEAGFYLEFEWRIRHKSHEVIFFVKRSAGASHLFYRESGHISIRSLVVLLCRGVLASGRTEKSEVCCAIVALQVFQFQVQWWFLISDIDLAAAWNSLHQVNRIELIC